MDIQKILDTNSDIVEYGLPTKGRYFVERSKKVGFKVCCYIIFRNGRALDAPYRDLFKLLAIGVRKGYVKGVDLGDPCGRCGGTGTKPEFAHVDKGVCFSCRGTGFTSSIVSADESTANFI